jgi:drug/metabolite transporter (DMT)-like permease
VLARSLLLTAASLACFAANSLLARRALGARLIDPATFTAVRLGAGALVLPVLAFATSRGPSGGSWGSALALLAYAAAFSFAYLRIGAGPGALLLFVAVQTTILGWGILHDARPSPVQWLGIAVALAGLTFLTHPGTGAVDPVGAVLMIAAGVAWGTYTLRGRSAQSPLATTAANFLRAAAIAVPAAVGAVLALAPRPATITGVVLAATSGALASGLGYSMWYAALPSLGATRAASVQLAVPVLTAIAATILLGERLTTRTALGGIAILGGIALTLRRAPPPGPRRARSVSWELPRGARAAPLAEREPK